MKYLALDLETSGLASTYDQIFQIGAAVMDSDGNVTDTFSKRIHPHAKTKFSIESLQVQWGEITPDTLKAWAETVLKAETSIQVFEQFRDWAAPYSKLPVIAWNANFDRAFFAQWRFQNKSRCVGTSVLSPVWICAMETAMNCPIHAGKSMGLDNIALHYGMTRSEAHNALEDAVLAGMVYNRLIKEEKTQ